MARRVSLPSPNLNPFGGEAQTFGEYEILDSGREKGIAFQKAQAAWSAGKISDEAYLGAYAKYVSTLPKNSSQRINAEEGLDRERYTLGRNAIQARIDAGDERAWYDLLAYDSASLAGRTANNDETRRRQGYLRSTQSSIFTIEWNKKVTAVQQQRMTSSQLRSWLQGQLGGGLTAGNAALASDIGGRIDDLTFSITEERREEVFRRWSDGEMDPGEFLNYAKQQLSQYSKGTAGYKRWNERLVDARMDVAEANLIYRWELSSRYRDNQQRLQSPAPGGKGQATRTVYTEKDGWQTVPVDTPPSPADQEAYAEWLEQKQVLQGEQRRIERALAGVGGQFVTPDQMVDWYRERQQRVAKGTPTWYALQEKIGAFRDVQAQWETFNTDNGYFPVVTRQGKVIRKTEGRSLPGEESVTVSTFMRALGSQFGGKVIDKAGGVNRFGVTPEQWKMWAGEYLDDASARQTPKNMEQVVRSKLTDLYSRYGSWALVADWWANGSHTGNAVTEWSGGTRSFVDSVWRAMGLGPLPSMWTFDPNAYGTSKVKLSPFGGGQGEYDVRSLIPAPQQQAGFGDGWGYRTDSGSGASLGDVSAGAAGYGVELTDQNINWNEFRRRLKNGESAVINGLMSEVIGTGLERHGVAFANTGSESRHSVHVIRYRDGKIFWQDPLKAEGTGKGEWVDEDVVLRFMLGFSSDPNDLAVAMSNRRVEQIPQLVDEHEAGPWTGCAWASTAMLINGVKGRRIVEMEDVRWRGESGRWQGNIFDAPYGGATTAELRQAALGGAPGGGKPRNKEKFPKTDGKGVPVTPGPQAGPSTYQWGAYDPQAAIGGSYGNPNTQTDMGTSQPKRGPGEFQMQVITGPPTKAGDRPQLQAVTGVEGMTPGGFDGLYNRAQKAYLAGETSFVALDANGQRVNYWFPYEGQERLTQMMGLDQVRIELREHEWAMAEADLIAAGDNPASQYVDAAAEANTRHLQALDEAGTNFIAMLFMDDPFREEAAPQEGQAAPAVNVNPGADIERIVAWRQKGIDVHLEQADRYIAAGLYTQGLAQAQYASDLAAQTERDLDLLATQLQGAVATQTAEGRQPTEQQRARITAATEWRDAFKFGSAQSPEAGTTLGEIEERIASISEWIAIDPMTKKPIIGVDGYVQMKPGTVFVLQHNKDKPDTLAPQSLDVQRATPGDTPTSFSVDRHLPGHLTGSVALMGLSVVAELPYTVDNVGYVRTEDGNFIDLMGKIINVNIDGRHQTIFENPFKPGEFSMVEDASGVPQGFIFDGPKGVGSDVDEKTGKPILSWKEGSTTYSMTFNQQVGGYEVISTPDADPLWLFNDQEIKPTKLGVVGASDDLRNQISSTFQRDVSAIPRDQMAASKMNGVTVGLTAQQYDALVIAETKRVQLQARAQGIARRVQPKMRYDVLSSAPTPASTSTAVPATSTPDAVKEMVAERQRTAAQASQKPTPLATPTSSPAPTPKATPVTKTTTTTTTKPPITYDPQASIGGSVPMAPVVRQEAPQGRTTYLGGGR